MNGSNELKIYYATLELIRTGLARAAKHLVEIAGQKIELKIDESLIEDVGVDQLQQFQKYFALSEQFNGDLDGTAVILLPESVVKVLLSDPCCYFSSESSGNKEFKKDALLELGNIIINACLGETMTRLNCCLVTELPVFYHGENNDVFEFVNLSNEPAKIFQIQFILDDISLDSYIIFLFEKTSVSKFERLVIREAE